MSRDIRLGLLYLGSRPTARVAEVAGLAEDAGFDYFWIPDERFFREVYSLCTIVAGATSRIQIGPCVTDPYTRHPALTAMAIATLDELSDQRSVLGIGAGISGFVELGLDQNRPALAVRESVELIRVLLRDGEADYEGQIIRFRGELNFKPPRAEVPVYIAAGGPRMLALAGESAGGVIIEACMAPQVWNLAMEHVRHGLDRAGRKQTDLDIVPRIDVAVAESLNHAYDALRPRLAKKLISSAPEFERFTSLGFEIPEELRERVSGLTYTWDPEVLNSLAGELPDEYMDAFFIAATPDTVGEKLTFLVERGATQIIVNPIPIDGDRIEPIINAVSTWREAH